MMASPLAERPLAASVSVPVSAGGAGGLKEFFQKKNSKKKV
jgi:hypothetical protein